MKFTVRVPRDARCFLLEDSEARIEWFRERLPSITVRSNASEAIEALAAGSYDVLFLDHDLGLLDSAGATGPEGSGKQVARYLSGTGYLGYLVVIHSWNVVGAAAMKDILKGAAAIPFGQFEIDLI